MEEEEEGGSSTLIPNLIQARRWTRILWWRLRDLEMILGLYTKGYDPSLIPRWVIHPLSLESLYERFKSRKLHAFNNLKIIHCS